VLQRNVRHLGEIFIEQLCDQLRLQSLCGRRKVFDVGKKIVSFFRSV
jgi:hypothetical protein